MKVLTVFIDGLKPESIEYMPFLNQFYKRRIKTELGYSNPCHTSMYSGVHPNKHLIWFIWKYSPNTSPFKWLKKYKIDYLPHNIYTKYLLYRITNFSYKNNTSAFGLPFLWYKPVEDWSYFDVVETKFWTEACYIDKYPTIFETLRLNNIDYEVVGLKKGMLNKSIDVINNHNFIKFADWTYLFIGEIDSLSHEFGQNSSQVQTKLKEIDNILFRIYNIYETQFGDFCFMLFSDHGHTMIKEKINIEKIFESHGYILKKYINFIDSNYARFWFRNEIEKREVISALSNMNEKGFILTESDLQKYKIDMPDNRYGDLIFYLDAPYVFDHGNIVIMGKERSDTGKYISFHGFLPDYPDSDGVLISNKELINKSHIKLQDIMPSILYLLNLNIPDNVDGEVIIKR
ncbi:MAG: alkaline phosphatase family protein [Candidatus Methanoperedens sp.]